ncbi:MAG: UDP-N-acetylglucosamine 1-carboxyvinyltransferase [Bacteroidales bacterium]|nr:UDP-N-acetylglucosamine 1-carboxyvinyltransferase [Clostridium sp.]MCM1202543.1 UDP-N-acetylglucosamine 1-carboxyvinyltransferase [Bacteroidales bacterium]
MKAISVKETDRLKGSIEIQGSKNTVLPIMAASLLSPGISVIYNCPMIEDVQVMCRLLECLHVKTTLSRNVLQIDTTQAEYEPLPYELTRKLRSSVLLLGPVLARWHRAEIGMPGGCAIGLRPIDIHLEGFVKMNVDVNLHNDILSCNTYYLQGCEYHLRFPSVGATENLIMAATGAKGRTILRGVAREPEIIELCNYLLSMGALIEGVGTDVLIIKGTKELTSCDYCNVYDRIVAGTYLLMAAAVPSEIKLLGIEDIHYMKNIIKTASGLGVNVVKFDHYLSVQSFGQVAGGDYETGIYPEFPTDLLPVLITVLLKAEEGGSVAETVFENRLGIVGELEKLEAKLYVKNQRVWIEGGARLQGHTVKATDLRQGAALVVAGLISKGYTTITDISYIERGYEDIVRDLQCLGVEIAYI